MNREALLEWNKNLATQNQEFEQKEALRQAKLEEQEKAAQAVEQEAARIDLMGGTEDAMDVDAEVSQRKEERTATEESNPSQLQPFKALGHALLYRTPKTLANIFLPKSMEFELPPATEDIGEFNYGPSNKIIKSDVAEEALNNPRYDEVLKEEKSSDLRDINSAGFYNSVLDKVRFFEQTQAYAKGRATELTGQGMHPELAYTRAQQEASTLFTAPEAYDASNTERGTILARQGKELMAVGAVMTDPWAIGATMLMAPVTAAFAIRGATGVFAPWIGRGTLANVFSRLGMTSVALDYVTFQSMVPIMDTIGDKLVDHPIANLATQFATGVFGVGTFATKLTNEIVGALPGAYKIAVRQYARAITDNLLSTGQVPSGAKQHVDRVVKNVTNALTATADVPESAVQRRLQEVLKARENEVGWKYNTSGEAKDYVDNLWQGIRRSLEQSPQFRRNTSQEGVRAAVEAEVDQLNLVNNSDALKTIQDMAKTTEQAFGQVNREIELAENKFKKIDAAIAAHESAGTALANRNALMKERALAENNLLDLRRKRINLYNSLEVIKADSEKLNKVLNEAPGVRLASSIGSASTGTGKDVPVVPISPSEVDTTFTKRNILDPFEETTAKSLTEIAVEDLGLPKNKAVQFKMEWQKVLKVIDEKPPQEKQDFLAHFNDLVAATLLKVAGD